MASVITSQARLPSGRLRRLAYSNRLLKSIYRDGPSKRPASKNESIFGGGLL